MSSAIQIFRFEEYPLRVLPDEQGASWWVAVDVCAVLGYANSTQALADHCEEPGVSKRYLSSGGQRREVQVINEGNLYRLILKSHKPNAKKFESWVCDEVLPALRKTGSYSLQTEQRESRFSLVMGELRELKDEVREVKGEVRGVAANCAILPTMAADVVEVKQAALRKRKDPTKATECLLWRVIRLKYGGLCPVTGERIMDENGEPIRDGGGRRIGVTEHMNGAHRNQRRDLWIVHFTANRLLELNRSKYRPDHEVFQRRADELEAEESETHPPPQRDFFVESRT